MYGNCLMCNTYIESDEEFCLKCEREIEYDNEFFAYYDDNNMGLIDEKLLKKKGITLNLVTDNEDDC